MMPSRSQRPCKHAGCKQLVARGYCDNHAVAAKQRISEQRNADPMRPYYKSVRWTSVREIVLHNEPICTACHMEPSTVVHHIVDARKWVQQGNDFYDQSNLTGICVPCHNSISRQRQSGSAA